MPRYQYKGYDGSGSVVEGVQISKNEDTLINELFVKDITPVEIKPAEADMTTSMLIEQKLGINKPTTMDLVGFSRKLETLVRSGVPIIESLRQILLTTDNPHFKLALQVVIQDVENGNNLSYALEQHPDIFTPLYANMVRMGEFSGEMDKILASMQKYLVREQETMDKVKKGLRYPIFVLIVIISALAVVVTFVIPTFAGMFEKANAELPLTTQIILATSQFAQAQWHILVIGFIGIWVGIKQYGKTAQGALHLDIIKLHLPVFGKILRESILSRFASTFSMATRSGVNLTQAIDITAKIADNKSVEKRLMQMKENLNQGLSMSRSAELTKLFPPLIIQMMKVGEQTGEMDPMMDEIQKYYERELEYMLDNIGAMIEPIMTIAMAGIVMIVAMGVFVPMWGMLSLPN